MKINIFKVDETVTFGDLQTGEVFIFDGRAFLKMKEYQTVHATNSSKFNAVLIASGASMWFNEKTHVIPTMSVSMDITY